MGRLMLNVLKSILKGEFIHKLNVGLFFPQIAYTFFLFTMFILLSLLVDNTLTIMENKKDELNDLKIVKTQKTYELVRLNRRSTVSTLLLESGSEVKEPEKPAIVLE